MNEQKANSANHIEWTRVIRPDGTRTKGYTWNPIAGCQHGCRWQMPDGKIAECYAENVAENVASPSYPLGFEHHYWKPQLLSKPTKMKEGVGIFIGSMADVFGAWVPDEQITAVLDVCRSTPQHIYFVLTKNAPRLLKFEFPDNVWVGASSPPDFMFGKPLSVEQREAMLRRTLKVLSEVKAKERWMSIEPLSHDYSAIFREYPTALTWAVIGAASDGKRKFPPSEQDLVNTLMALDVPGIPIFYKGNMRSLPYAAAHWREGFPGVPTTERFVTSPALPAEQPAEFREFAMMTPDGLVRGTAEELAAMKAPSVEPIESLIADLPSAVEVTPMVPKPAVTWDTLTDPPAQTTVANFNHVYQHWNKATRQWDDPKYVYIGRFMPSFNLPSSMFANPFKIKSDTPEKRAAAIEQYRTWIKGKLASPVEGERYRAELEALRGKHLVCWCADPDPAKSKACHGDVLRELLGEAVDHVEPPKPEAPPVQMSLFDDEPVKKTTVYA